MKVYRRYLKYRKAYEGIWKYMEVYKVYPDILKNPPSLARSIARSLDRYMKVYDGLQALGGISSFFS